MEIVLSIRRSRCWRQKQPDTASKIYKSLYSVNYEDLNIETGLLFIFIWWDWKTEWLFMYTDRLRKSHLYIAEHSTQHSDIHDSPMDRIESFPNMFIHQPGYKQMSVTIFLSCCFKQRRISTARYSFIRLILSSYIYWTYQSSIEKFPRTFFSAGSGRQCIVGRGCWQTGPVRRSRRLLQ